MRRVPWPHTLPGAFDGGAGAAAAKQGGGAQGGRAALTGRQTALCADLLGRGSTWQPGGDAPRSSMLYDFR